MGMFDSFILKHNDKEIEVQTKRFDCNLDYWKIGDCVDPAPHGVVTYYDSLFIDDNGKQVWKDGEENTEIYITIANGIFVESKILIGYRITKEKEKLHIINAMNEKWQDTNTFINFAVEQLRFKQNKIKNCESKINNISYKLKTWLDSDMKQRDERGSILASMRTIPEEIKDDFQMLEHLQEEIDNKTNHYNYEFDDINELEQYKL
jgi:hypothetical protein